MNLITNLAITFTFGLVFLWIIFTAKKQAKELNLNKKSK